MLVAGVGRDARFVVKQLEARRSAIARGVLAGESARRASAA